VIILLRDPSTAAVVCQSLKPIVRIKKFGKLVSIPAGDVITLGLD
jgi:hypothetical protein